MKQGELLQRIPNDAFEEVYRTHADRLWRAVLAFAGDREIASDAVAEAFAQALRRGRAIRDPASWVWRTAFRVAAGELKDRRRIAGDVLEAAYDPPEPVADLISSLRTLSPKQRGAIVLFHYAGYSVSEVATILGSTGPAVRVHLHRARRRLRELLDQEPDG